MTEQTGNPASDDFENKLDEVLAANDMRRMEPDEMELFIADGKRLTAAAGAKAKAEGRRFLSEEQDGELIETWKAEAQACDSIDAACEFARRLMTDYRHDYGTICHALAYGAVAMANGMNSESGGITGFQAGFVWWGFFKGWMREGDKPFRMVDYSDLLFPQYESKFRAISKETAEWAIAKANELLAEHPDPNTVHPDVRAHWQSVAAGVIPFGFTIDG